MQAASQVSRTLGHNVLGADATYGTGQVTLLNNTVTDDNQFVEHGIVFLEGDIHIAPGLQSLGLVAHIRYLNGSTDGCVDAELTVRIGYRTLAVSIGNAYSNQGFTGLVGHGSLDCTLGIAQ